MRPLALLAMMAGPWMAAPAHAQGQGMTLQPARLPGMCLALTGPAGEAQSRPCDGGAAEKFDLPFPGGGEIRIADKCLAPQGEGNYPALLAVACNGSPEQTWTMTEAGEIHTAVGRCLSVLAASSRTGELVYAADCPKDDPGQLWRARKVDFTNVADASLESLARPGQCIGADPQLGLYACTDNFRQIMSFDEKALGQVRMMSSCLSGGFVFGALRLTDCWDIPDQRWVLFDDGRIANEKVQCIEVSSEEGRDVLRTKTCRDAPEQRWRVRKPVNAAPPPAAIEAPAVPAVDVPPAETPVTTAAADPVINVPAETPAAPVVATAATDAVVAPSTEAPVTIAAADPAVTAPAEAPVEPTVTTAAVDVRATLPVEAPVITAAVTEPLPAPTVEAPADPIVTTAAAVTTLAPAADVSPVVTAVVDPVAAPSVDTPAQPIVAAAAVDAPAAPVPEAPSVVTAAVEPVFAPPPEAPTEAPVATVAIDTATTPEAPAVAIAAADPAPERVADAPADPLFTTAAVDVPAALALETPVIVTADAEPGAAPPIETPAVAAVTAASASLDSAGNPLAEMPAPATITTAAAEPAIAPPVAVLTEPVVATAVFDPNAAIASGPPVSIAAAEPAVPPTDPQADLVVSTIAVSTIATPLPEASADLTLTTVAAAPAAPAAEAPVNAAVSTAAVAPDMVPAAEAPEVAPVATAVIDPAAVPPPEAAVAPVIAAAAAQPVTPPVPLTRVVTTLQHEQLPGMCMSLSGPSGETESRPCDGSELQNFQLPAAAAPGPIRNGDRCLAPRGKGMYPQLVAETCNGAPAQTWLVTADGEVHGANGRCLSLLGTSSRNGERIYAGECPTGLPAHRWHVVAVDPVAVHPIAAMLEAVSRPGKCLGTDGALGLVACDARLGRVFSFDLTSPGLFRMMSSCIASGFTQETVSLGQCWDLPSQKWMLTATGNLANLEGKCISVAIEEGRDVLRTAACLPVPELQWTVKEMQP